MASDSGSSRRGRVRKALLWIVVAASVAALLTAVIAIVVRSGVWTADIPQLLDRASAWSASPIAPLAMLAGFIVGGLVVFPVNILIAASIVLFGPIAGASYALAGSVLSAAVLYEIGRSFPEGAFARLVGAHGERLRQRVARHGFLAIVVVRLLPIAPYSIVSVAAGAVRIARIPYLAGTALGMLPGVLLYAFFIDRARDVIANPRPLSWAMLAFALVLIGLVALALRRYRRRMRVRDGDAA